jgi:hypothetical protein
MAVKKLKVGANTLFAHPFADLHELGNAVERDVRLRSRKKRFGFGW